MSLINFSAVDLGQLPASDLLAPVQFDTLYNELKQALAAACPDLGEPLPSDPLAKLMEVFAYRELLLRHQINEGAQQVLLAKATSSELDYLGNRFLVTREVDESDARFRERIRLALEGFSTAGPIGAYCFHAFKALPQVKDVFVESPEFALLQVEPPLSELVPAQTKLLHCTHAARLQDAAPGDVAITVLTDSGNGIPSQDEITAITDYLFQEEIRPLTDRPRILAAEVKEFTLHAKLYLYPGPDEQKVKTLVERSVKQWLQAHHKLNHDIRMSGLYGALHQTGVQRVELVSPTEDIINAPWQAAYCTKVEVEIAGRDI
ncbi:baseplate J/gp47 family protein [Pseudoalteromonas sp. McH1-7]|uniref:baseplate assembly protein n=1 Tax=Pseudoalteromonas sp. McH1-7 TaxID=2745574 RepID=UPI001591C46B|nr:baseplate J/gp47 family protein [Pseudoalteromonas sp. McH1-7]NUZ11754.1 baseplate J/gp47 family protein [Pseudoalteromonas sp. McH1-7]